MPVAKSYSSYAIVKEPYCANGKKYVDIDVNGKIKTVRWYSNLEYSKMYNETITTFSMTPDDTPQYKTQKEILGFTNGYITFFGGEDTYFHRDYFKSIPNCTYRRNWGWSIPGGQDIPTDLPEGIIPYRLDWDKIKISDTKMTNDDDAVMAVINEIKYSTQDPGNYVGEVGERLEITAKVVKKFSTESYYGLSTCYNLVDDNNNHYTWFTSSKTIDWSEGEVPHFKGTVKKHEKYHGVCTTVLTRCNIIK